LPTPRKHLISAVPIEPAIWCGSGNRPLSKSTPPRALHHPVIGFTEAGPELREVAPGVSVADVLAAT
jgi:hypothetical protein